MKTCMACGTKLKFLGEAEAAGIFQCPSCGLGVTSDGEQEEYKAYHRDPVYIKEEKLFRNIFQKRARMILQFKKKGRALEVGSSTGLFLSLLKDEGWEVQGVEPSRVAVQAAKRRGVDTLNTTFEKAKIEDKFDLVIFNHVLEHMQDPIGVLKKANSVLKKGGLILVDVPNFASLTARIKGTGWQLVLPREHRWHFTPTSLFVLLEKANFTPLYWEAHSGIWGYANPLGEVMLSLRTLKKRFFWNVITAIPAYLLTKFNAGTGLTVIAQKVN